MIRQNLLLAGDDGYNLTKSLRFRSSASAYLNRTPASAGNQQKWTWSGWVKIGKTENQALFAARTTSSGTYTIINIDTANNVLRFVDNTTSSPTCETSAYYRDYAGWYHFVVSVDTTQATASNRIKIYTNGVLQTLSVANYPSQNANLNINSTATHLIGQQASGAYFDGYMAEVNFIDGQALTPSSFGSTNALTGVWQPAKYTGTYGTNGFYLPFTNTTSTSTLGNDFSGNSNTWTVNNISLTTGSTYDSMNDVPTLTSATQANYCVWNPNWKDSTQTVSNGNLKVESASNSNGLTLGTITVSSGKWYWETTIGGAASMWAVGIVNPTIASPNYSSLTSGNSYAWNNSSQKYNGQSASSYGATYTTGDVLGVALDLDGGTITFYKNNTSQGTAFTGITGTFTPMVLINASSDVSTNFGQQPFTYTPPTGFVALNTYNLPTSTIVKGNTVMDGTLYTGNGGATQTITNTAGFKPDLVWIKDRSVARNNDLLDSIRGPTTGLFSNLTNAEVTSGYLSSFNSNGFTTGNDVSTNGSGETFVGWQWQAGQGSSSSNTNGSITSTVSVNATAGFSVVTFTAQTSGTATVGHGLGVAPKMIITKVRNGTSGWTTYFWVLDNTQYIVLNETSAAVASSTAWNNTSPTSSVFTLGSSFAAPSQTMVAYCWAEIAGFSKFGSYTGNGSADGPFVYTGFRPRFILYKNSSISSEWVMLDSVRNTYNVQDKYLFANSADAEGTFTIMDFLSNGFKLRTSNITSNGSGNTFIYMAFAENPFKNSLAR